MVVCADGGHLPSRLRGPVSALWRQPQSRGVSLRRRGDRSSLGCVAGSTIRTIEIAGKERLASGSNTETQVGQGSQGPATKPPCAQGSEPGAVPELSRDAPAPSGLPIVWQLQGHQSDRSQVRLEHVCTDQVLDGSSLAQAVPGRHFPGGYVPKRTACFAF